MRLRRRHALAKPVHLSEPNRILGCHGLDGYANFADVWNRDHGHSALYDPRAALMDELGTAVLQLHGTAPRAR